MGRCDSWGNYVSDGLIRQFLYDTRKVLSEHTVITEVIMISHNITLNMTMTNHYDKFVVSCSSYNFSTVSLREHLVFFSNKVLLNFDSVVKES